MRPRMPQIRRHQIESSHYAYKKPGEPKKIYPSAVTASLSVDGPLQCVVGDMTAFWAGGKCWEPTLYMGLWNDEIVGYGLSSRKGDRNTYFDGLEMVAEEIKKIDGLNPILHTDQGTVYASKGFNELLPPISYHAFDVPRWSADGQRGDGGRERAGQNRDVHRFRRGPLRRRAVVR